MAQQQVQKQTSQVRDTEIDDAPAAVETTDVTDTLDAIDDVLDEQLDAELLADIDDLLEENAQEFVDNFVQAGGE